MNWLAQLNEAQLKAVIHPHGPLFVVAGAGTGKTKTLTTRIAYLIMEGVLSERILAVTFTNKAAREMKERVIDMVGPHGSNLWLYTFHAFGLKVLRTHIAVLPYGYRPNFTVIDEDDGKKIIDQQIKDLGLDSKKYSLRGLKALISLFKSNRLDGFERTDEERIYQRYQDYLKENQLVDFDDLLLYTLELFENYREVRDYYQTLFDHILVDEFQDTDAIQYRILRIMGEKHRNLFVVGDPDQSIYSFRGANYQNNERFIRDFGADRVMLEQNYRSTNLILKAANKLISFNIDRPAAKNLASDLGTGVPPVYHGAETGFRETYFVINEIERLRREGHRYEDMVVLYRNNALSRLFEDAFIKQGIPYMIYGGISFYQRKEIKDILAYVRVALDPKLDFYLQRIINVPKRSLGQISIQKLSDTARNRGESLFEAIEYVDLRPQARKSLNEFKKLVFEIQQDFDDMESLEQVIPYVIAKTGYLDMLKADESEISDDRIDNLKELQTVFVRGEMYYEGSFRERVAALLDQIALYTDLDQEVTDTNRIKLSTIHQVKGLEFPVVFMAVMEEGLFPSDRSLEDPRALEEERRICYVGMTRAKRRLYLSYAKQRMVYGSMRFARPSRFIEESRLGYEKKDLEPRPTSSDYLSTGDRVEHSVFGLGVVIAVEDEVATIAFAMPHGIKKLIESHPALKKIRSE
ncbi:MAG: ATP-dependent helicase [Acholeplasmataceae bacterium]